MVSGEVVGGPITWRGDGKGSEGFGENICIIIVYSEPVWATDCSDQLKIMMYKESEFGQRSKSYHTQEYY
jgi:hypothetical protein